MIDCSERRRRIRVDVWFGSKRRTRKHPLAAIRQFRITPPHIALRLDDSEALDIRAALVNGDLDVAIVRALFRHKGIDVELLLQQRFVLALPNNHPLVRKKHIAVSTLADEPFILFPPHVAPRLYDTITSIRIEAGFSPDVAREASSWFSVISLVKADLDITIAPSLARDVRPEMYCLEA